ncbi:MAG: hypothetical protein ACR2O0_01005 [Rhizobiaceae bacterium]
MKQLSIVNILWVAAFVVPLLLGAQANAQNDQAPPDPGARYELKPFENGYIRMSRETGAISFCTLVTGSLVCRLGADEREAFEETLSALEERLEFAEERLDAVEAKLGEISKDGDFEERRQERFSDQDDSESFNKQAEEELDKAFDFAQQAMKRFVESVKELRKDLEEKYNEE